MIKESFRKAMLRSRESGISVIQVMIAIPISLAVVSAGGTMFSRTMANQKHMKIQADLARIRSSIVQRIDCPATIAALAGTCTVNNTIAIRSKNGMPDVVPRPAVSGGTLIYPRVGDIALFAICDNRAGGGKKITVKYAMLLSRDGSDNGRDYVTDPFTKESMDWTNGIDLFEGIPVPCELPF